jgi:hypothetical protein
MAYGVADGIHQREDFQQEGLLACAPAEILEIAWTNSSRRARKAFSKARKARIRRGASGG